MHVLGEGVYRALEAKGLQIIYERLARADRVGCLQKQNINSNSNNNHATTTILTCTAAPSTYRPTYLPSYLHTCLPTYLSTTYLPRDTPNKGNRLIV